MAWSTLPAYSDGNALTAAQVTAIKDNINESAPAKATTTGRIFVATGTNAIAERRIAADSVLTGETTTSTSFTTLATAGPTVSSITTGTLAIIDVVSQVNNTTDGASARHSYVISGATTTAADDDWSALIQATSSRDCTQSRMTLFTLTGGSNTFASRYRVSSGTGRWQDRGMTVIAL